MSKSKIKELVNRYLRFAASTLAGPTIDMLVLWLCSDYLFKGYYWGEYLLSPFISFECAVLVNFALAYFAVWKDRISARNLRSFFRHYVGYNLSCTGTFLLKMVVLLFIERSSDGWDVLICNILALCVSGILNFALNEMLVFKRKKAVE